MSVSYIHCQFSRAAPGIATLQRGFWSRAGAWRSQEGTGAGLTKWTSSGIINRPLTGWKPVPQLAVAEIAREDEETVRGNRDASGVRQTVHAAAIRGHAARIALRVGIEKVVVDVAVEDFLPVATAGKAEPVAVIVERVF